MNIIQYEKQEKKKKKNKKKQRCNTKKQKNKKNTTITDAQQARRDITDLARDENNHPPKAQKDYRRERQTKTRVRLEVIR